MESLEGRQLHAAVFWDGGGDGATWTSVLNWSTNTLPTASDDVTINHLSHPVVTSGTNVSIKSLTLADSLTITGGTFTLGNAGTSSLGGALTLSGGTLNLAGTWADTGTFAMSGGTLNLGGTTTTTGLNFAAWTRTGGTVNLTGTVNNTGNTLALSPSTGNIPLVGGTIVGGTITASGAVFSVSASGTLDGVTLATDTSFTGAGSLTIKNGLALNSTLNASGSSAYIDFLGTQSLTGSGTVALDGAVVRVRRTASSPVGLTVGSGITLRGKGSIKSASTSAGFDTLLNQGTIISDSPAGTLSTTAAYLNFTNDGLIRATSGTLVLNTGTGASAGTFAQTPNGTLSVEGGTATLAGAWNSAGLTAVSGGTVNLGQNFAGTTTTAGLGTWSRTGGTVNFDGVTVDNTNAALTLDASTGSWNFLSGTIKGGTFSTVSITPQFVGITLDGVTLNANASVPANSTLAVKNGLTLNGTLEVSASTAYVDFLGTQTLDGTGTVSLVNGILRTRRPSTSAVTLTIGSGVTIHGKGTIRSGSTSGADAILNQGTIISDFAGGTLATYASFLNFTNEGTMGSTAGTFNINYGSGSGIFINSLTGHLAVNGGSMNLYGTYLNLGLLDLLSGVFNGVGI